MKNEIDKYLHDCKKVFPFIGIKEKEFFNRFRENVDGHFEDGANIRYLELVQKIGSPKDIMISYIQDCDNDYIVKKMHFKNLMKKFFIIISIALITGLSVICYYELKTIEQSKNQQIITEETIIEQNDN